MIPVGVLHADAYVWAVNHQLAVPGFRQPASLLDGFLLCFVGRADVAVDFAGPLVAVGDYMYAVSLPISTLRGLPAPPSPCP